MRNQILLVDDDELLISALSIYLSSHGFIIQSATSVNAALDLLNIQIPDLIISDIVMPKRDGYALLQLLKNTLKYKTIPLIFLSAKGMTPDRITGYNLGCHGYLVKPFNPEELLAMIQNILSNLKINESDQLLLEDRSSNLRDIEKDRLQELESFTFRENTILKCVLKGMTNKEIAVELSLSLRNVEKYVSRLLLKTSTRNRTELTQYCYKKKLNYLEGE